MTMVAEEPRTAQGMRLRAMTPEDRSEVAELITVSLNTWCQSHGRPPIITGGPKVSEVFYDVYSALEPGCAIVAEDVRTGRLTGSCFYHPRPSHVSLGIMNVHPNHFGRGVARALLNHIVDFTERGGYPSLRLTSSALNLDSFSLYTKAGFVPRATYQDMYLQVPQSGIGAATPAMDRVREATMADVEGMVAVEMAVTGLVREADYRYCLKNDLGFWHTSVIERPEGGIEGFAVSTAYPGLSMIGPCVARTEEAATALLLRELDHHRGRLMVFLPPVDQGGMVRRMYDLGARNCEIHVYQVRGAFTPFQGVSMPTFLPETG